MGIAAVAFVMLFGYELARSSVESLFLERHGSDALPWAWVAVACATLGVVWVYSSFAVRVPLLRLFAVAIGGSAGTLVAAIAYHRAGLPGSLYVLYVWKDVHVVVLLEMLWTFANLVFRVRTARWSYGGFLVAGSLGGLTGGLAVGALSARYGTEAVLGAPLVPLTLLGVGTICAPFLLRRAVLPSTVLPRTVLPRTEGPGLAAPPARDQVRASRETSRSETSSSEAVLGRLAPGLRGAVETFRASPYLPWMLALVVIVQVVITVIDYQYNHALELAYPVTDERTQVMGWVYASINVGAILLQAASGFILRFAGVPAVLLAVPVLLAAGLSLFVATPRFALAAVVKISSKVLDYSLFKSAKEILYIPLGYAEKTRGKAAIDMLGYRVAKGGASVLLGFAVGLDVPGLLPIAGLLLIGAWVLVTLRIVHRYRAILSRREELHGPPKNNAPAESVAQEAPV
jgi:AAA family ATP:ADP antiporter